MSWTKQDLLRLDAEFAQAGVAMHARPLRAANSLLGSGFVIGVLGNPEVDRIVEAYRWLFPDVDQAWPGKGVGLEKMGVHSTTLTPISPPLQAGVRAMAASSAGTARRQHRCRVQTTGRLG